jgi:hypothetical protein
LGGHCPAGVQVLDDDVLGPPGRVQQPLNGLPGIHNVGNFQTFLFFFVFKTWLVSLAI